MGIQAGSFSLCRYQLLGGSQKPYKLSELNKLLESKKSPSLRLDKGSKEEEYGWVRPVGIDHLKLPPEAPWDLSHAQVEGGFFLRMRILKRKVPQSLLQLIYRQRFFDLEEKKGKAPAPKERRDLREAIKQELLERALPEIQHIDAFWRDPGGELFLFSTSKKAQELFSKLYHDTFASPLGLQMVKLEPPLIGLESLEWDYAQGNSDLLRRIADASPIVFTGNPST